MRNISLIGVSNGNAVEALLGAVVLVDKPTSHNMTIKADDSSMCAVWTADSRWHARNWFADYSACCSTTDVNTVWHYKYHDSLENCDVTCLAVEQIGNLDRLVYFISEVINTMTSMSSTLTLHNMYLERTSTLVEDCNVEGLMHNKESWLLVLPNVRTNDLNDITNLPCLEH